MTLQQKQERFVQNNMGFIVQQTRKYFRYFPQSSALSFEDLLAEGITQVVAAAKSYKPSKGRPTTYIGVTLHHRYHQLQKKEWQANGGYHNPIRLDEYPDRALRAPRGWAGFLDADAQSGWREKPDEFTGVDDAVDARMEDGWAALVADGDAPEDPSVAEEFRDAPSQHAVFVVAARAAEQVTVRLKDRPRERISAVSFPALEEMVYCDPAALPPKKKMLKAARRRRR